MAMSSRFFSTIKATWEHNPRVQVPLGWISYRTQMKAALIALGCAILLITLLVCIYIDKFS